MIQYRSLLYVKKESMDSVAMGILGARIRFQCWHKVGCLIKASAKWSK